MDLGLARGGHAQDDGWNIARSNCRMLGVSFVVLAWDRPTYEELT